MSLKLGVETGLDAEDGRSDGDSGNPIPGAASNRGAIRFVCRRRRRCVTSDDEMSEIGKR